MVGKYLLQISIRELHNNYIKTKLESELEWVWKGKKLLVSNDTLRYLLPKQVKTSTPRYNKMCGYEIFLHCKQLQRTLSSWIKRHTCNKHRYTFAVFSDSNVLFLSPRDAINEILCLKHSVSNLLKWKYTLRQCVSCPM